MNPLLDPALMTAVLAAAERVINRALDLAPGGSAGLDALGGQGVRTALHRAPT